MKSIFPLLLSSTILKRRSISSLSIGWSLLGSVWINWGWWWYNDFLLLYLHYKLFKLSCVHRSIRMFCNKFLKILSHLQRLNSMRYRRLNLHLLWIHTAGFTECHNILFFKGQFSVLVSHVSGTCNKSLLSYKPNPKLDRLAKVYMNLPIWST